MTNSRFDFDTSDNSTQAFESYHKANPQVYAALRMFALQARAAGRQRMSINMLHERIRWYTVVEEKGSSFKVNNNWRPFYARLLMLNEPTLANFFHLRKAAADEIIPEMADQPQWGANAA